MAELELGIVRNFLEGFFQTKEITELISIPELTVNTILTFRVASEKYLMKVLTREPTSRDEYYRLEKEAQLLKHFARASETKGLPENQKVIIPVPRIIHVETNERAIGFKFEIMSFVPGITLKECWKKITLKQKSALTKQIARIVKGIHSLKYEMFGAIGQYDSPRRFYSYDGMLKADLRRCTRALGKSKIIPIELLMSAEKFVEKNLPVVAYNGEPTLVHADLNSTNFLVEEKEQAIWQVTALLDFEWAFAGNPKTDLYDLYEILPEKEVQELFFEEYFERKEFDWGNHLLEQKVHQVISTLESLTFGWIHFHPAKENIEWAIEIIQKAINNT